MTRGRPGVGGAALRPGDHRPSPGAHARRRRHLGGAGSALVVGLGCAGCSLTVSLPGFTYEVFQGLLGALVWILANATYLDYRREGRPRGFRRLLAFWFGLPTTFLVRLFVPEGRPERLAPDELNAEGEEALLLAEIRAAAVSRTAGRAAGQELAGGHPAEKDDSDDLGDHP